MKLKIGKMTNQDLADWFGVTKKTITNNKQKWLTELKDYAKFYEEKGKVIITEVYQDEYMSRIKINQIKIKKEFPKVWRELDTCKRAGAEIAQNLKNEIELSQGVVEKYTRLNRTELYGNPKDLEGGTIGNCSYIWAKKSGDGANAVYELLTKEEEKIKEEVIRKYYGNTTEKQIIVKGMIASGEIKKEDAWEVLEELTGSTDGKFFDFFYELQEKIGATLVRATKSEKYIEEEGYNFEI